MDSGDVKLIADAYSITGWRTAAASALAYTILSRNRRKIDILGVIGSGTQARYHLKIFTTVFDVDEIYIYGRNRAKASKIAYSMAGASSKDIDVAEVHDAFSILGLINIEDLGFVSEKGKAAKLLCEGRFRPGDKPTVNPSGGLKARGHPVGATGVYQVAEVAMQLRGDFPGVKVSNANIGLAQSIGGVGSIVTVIILKR